MCRKRLALMLAATMMMSLAACGGTNEEETDTQTNESEQVGEADESETTYDPYGKYEETVKVTLANQIDTTKQPNGDTYNDNAYWDYIKDTMNIELEYEIESPDDYGTALSLAMTSGDLPDIIAVYDYSMLVEMVNEGLVQDLTEVYENYASDYVKEWYGGFDSPFEKVTFDGKLMALPRATYENGGLVAVRQDWLDKLNIVVDEDGDGLITREELEIIADEFVSADPGNSGNPIGIAIADSAGSEMVPSSNIVNNSFDASVGWWIEAEDGSYVNGITVPEMKEALTWWADMYSKGLVDEQYGVTQTDDIAAMVVNGQLGIVFGDITAGSWFYGNVFEADPNADFVYYGLDNGSGTMTHGQLDVVNRFIVVSKDCENPEIAVKLLNLFIDLYGGRLDTDEIKNAYPDFYETYCAANKSGNPEVVCPLKLAPSFADALETRVKQVEDYLAGNISMDEVTDAMSKQFIDALEKVEAGTDDGNSRKYAEYFEAIKSWTTMKDSGKVDIKKYPTQISTDVTALYASDLKTLATDMMIKIITGEESVEYFDTFVEEYYNRGGEEISKEYEEFYK